MLKDLADSKRIDTHIWSKLRDMDGGDFLKKIKEPSFGDEDMSRIEKCLEEGGSFMSEDKENVKEEKEEEEKEKEKEK
eukprot:CAMPEP_0201514130 /NCGR_PEP_ID=MMETSP0161_2-20130828/6039_1 /ASSEMBLY_ACC=CAM_ASM_000251 /TAXON_ID=180227 /ORGANISM="Neoparamoeba aestuarina, Strain SoJaBio B1-5/56/2" /LENGTH=77 /DNA_ID=CAMNT_0047910589 /DNA_START=74 /DNA_END=304 /DNA_ORIENTATION=+